MSTYLKGEWVTCLDASRTSGSGLTLGQNYQITKDDNLASLIFITNDQGKEDCYHSSRFKKSTKPVVTIPMFLARMHVLRTARALSVGDVGIAVEWVETGVGYLVFRLVSELFNTVPLTRRHQVFDEALQRTNAMMVEEYEIIYDAMTPVETRTNMKDYY